jgi:4-amino-4-deoxy-L-arabinose transferase-like glycosyltransferase
MIAPSMARAGGEPFGRAAPAVGRDSVPFYVRTWRPWTILVLLCLALYVPGLAALPATDRDESRFMQASRQMVESGDLVRIRFQDEARNKKPAAAYWLQAASVAAFSDPASTERWPYRLPSMLGAIAAVLLLFAAGQVLFDRRTAFLAAAMLGTSFLLVIEAHVAKTDALLLAATMTAHYALARVYMAGHDGAPAGRGIVALFWLAQGLGLLIKGPILPLVSAATIATLIVSRHGRFLVRALRPLWGVPLALVVAAPWFVAIVFLDENFIAESAGTDFFAKLISGQEAKGAPPGLYLFLLMGSFAPATLFLIPGLWWATRARRQKEVAFLLAWLVPYWIVLELVPTKLPHYVLPLYPALALVLARAVLAVEEGLHRGAGHWLSRLGYLVWLGVALALPVGGFILVWQFGGRLDSVWLYLPIAAALVFGLYAVRLLWRGEARRGMIVAVFAAPLVMAPVAEIAFPRALGLWPSHAAYELFRRHEPGPAPRPPVFFAGHNEPSVVFYFGAATVLETKTPVVELLPKDKRAYVFVVRQRAEAFQQAATARGLGAERLGAVRGFNVPRGRRVELVLFRTEAAR